MNKMTINDLQEVSEMSRAKKWKLIESSLESTSDTSLVFNVYTVGWLGFQGHESKRTCPKRWIYPSSKQAQKTWELQCCGICCQWLGVDNPKAAFNQINRDIEMCDPNETHRQTKHSKLLVVKCQIAWHEDPMFFTLLQAVCSTSFSQATVKQPPSSYTMHGLVVFLHATLLEFKI